MILNIKFQTKLCKITKLKKYIYRTFTEHSSIFKMVSRMSNN